MRPIDHTHDPALRSWVGSALGHPDFPIQNLPFGRFRVPADEEHDPEEAVPAVAIGDEVLDLVAAADAGLLPGAAADAVDAWVAEGMAAFLGMGPDAWGAVRRGVSELLRADTEEGAEAREMGETLVRPARDVELILPADVGDYTDFYASLHHATNVGSMFRPDNPLLPNYKWVPIGYHGRASSLVPSGTAIRRPMGQVQQGEAPPAFGPSRQLDYELELGAVVGVGNPLGRPIPIEHAEGHLFGLVLLNDWSARDVQRWEYQPLGPFLAKNFASTISPWIVTLEALAPFRIPAFKRPAGDPEPLAYLHDPDDERSGGFGITLEVLLATRTMQEQGFAPARISIGGFGGMYWTMAQMLAHHASNGCNLRPGDLIGSGTISGPEPETRGCLLERTWRGTEPIRLPSGETRKFLEDGDEVTFRAWCERPGQARIGFGECRGTIAGNG